MTPIIASVITEKSMRSASRGIYTFKVALDSTKSQIKQAIETMFKVNVISLNILRRHVSAKSTGSKRLTGNPSQIKFVSLHLAKGQSIELFDVKDSAEAGQGK